MARIAEAPSASRRIHQNSLSTSGRGTASGVSLQCVSFLPAAAGSHRSVIATMKHRKAAEDRATLADQADIHELYEEAVQDVEMEVEFLQQTFQTLRGRTAYQFREDFCGTASASCQRCA